MQSRTVEPRKTDFSEAYRVANPAQKQAIDQIDGTLLVVAGPGTGKTQIIAARIANIINRGNPPEAILCLTYTDAGTIAMRERLLQFIGSHAYRVSILTFHSFCNLVIQDNPMQFGYGDLRPVSELEQREFVKQTLDSLPLENPLAREKGDLYNDCKKLLNQYAIIKREDWNIEAACGVIDRYIESLPSSPDMRYKRKTTRDGIIFNAGDLMQHKIDAEIRKFERTRAALHTYPVYQQILIDNSRYDFDDMILWVISAFKQNQALLFDYQERFQYLLVDEYQDTSTSQNEIVNLLMSYWDDPNLFVVGDDDQSIYRFQGASVANILDFNTTYRPALVTLTHNYRSSQQILTAAQALIGNNTRRLANRELYPYLDIDKTLTAVKGDAELPEIRIFPTSIQESIAIGLELGQLHRSGCDLGDMAVLYHTHRQVDDLIAYLSAAGVPYSTRKRSNVLTDPYCMQLLSILKYLAGEYSRPHSGEGELFRILHYPQFGHDPLEIARLYGRAPREERRLPIRHLLHSSTCFSRISQLIESTLTRIEAVTIQELVHEIINRFGMLGGDEDTRETLWHLELLNTIFDFVKDGSAKNPRLSLAQLVGMINSMESQNIELPAQRIALNSTGINLVTAHSSKGLEFDSVYLMGCTESDWEGQRTRNDFSLPPGIGPGSAEQDDDEELRRLFFVAMTRAKRRLVISYPERSNNDKPLSKSRFVAELEQSGSVSVNACQLDEQELAHALKLRFQPRQPDRESVFNSDFVGELLSDYRLSFSHLNQYLECPRTFFYTHVLRVPTPKNAATAYGTAAHNSLEFLFRSLKESPGTTFPPKEAFLEFFTCQMNKQQDAFTDVEFQRRVAGGSASMARLYDENIDRWHRNVMIEQSFEAVMGDGICIVGRVDKLELYEEKQVNLVDYKTGNYDRKKFQPPNPDKVIKAESDGKTPAIEDRFGGTYWRQAVFYKLLLESSHAAAYHVASAQFCFVEPDATSGKFVNQKVEISQEDMKFVTNLIETVHQGIMNREFGTECGRKYCRWCQEISRK